eukprot:13195638-Alexandrium_andersonii.AAC.1
MPTAVAPNPKKLYDDASSYLSRLTKHKDLLTDQIKAAEESMAKLKGDLAMLGGKIQQAENMKMQAKKMYLETDSP